MPGRDRASSKWGRDILAIRPWEQPCENLRHSQPSDRNDLHEEILWSSETPGREPDSASACGYCALSQLPSRRPRSALVSASDDRRPHALLPISLKRDDDVRFGRFDVEFAIRAEASHVAIYIPRIQKPLSSFSIGARTRYRSPASAAASANSPA